MFAVTRDAIADALSTVDGVRGYAKKPTVPVRGNAWPVLGPLERGPGDAWSATWQVLVVLDQDEARAVDEIDALLPDLVDALDGVLFLTGAEPVPLELRNGGVLFCLQLEGISE
jgi:hypothetical protein